MNLIASAARNWAIGYENKLLVRIPEDMRRFREMTMGKVVVMGRKTLESLPGKKPLSGRINVVCSKTWKGEVPGIFFVSGKEKAMEFLKQFPREDIYIMGGAQIYRLFLPECSTAYITRLEQNFTGDAFLPDLEKEKDWKLEKEGMKRSYSGLEYTYQMFVRK